MAKVLIGYSADPVVRAAFQRAGHEAWTCDLLPARDDSAYHLQCDVWEVLGEQWDMAILHPMCTYLTVSAAWAYGDGPYHQKVKPGTLVGAARRLARDEALENFQRLLDLPYPVAIENPAPSFVSKRIRPPSQVIQPYMFGEDASKSTGLWLTRGVPLLRPTKHVPGREVITPTGVKRRWANQTDSGQNRLPPSENRWLIRSASYAGISEAMGAQWGEWLSTPPPRRTEGEFSDLFEFCGKIVTVSWDAWQRSGTTMMVSIDGRPRDLWSTQVQQWADDAAHQRMAECGAHARRPGC